MIYVDFAIFNKLLFVDLIWNNGKYKKNFLQHGFPQNFKNTNIGSKYFKTKSNLILFGDD
ncbi:MAG TPA: hypothetical protein PK294_11495 [Ignavibacteria bacterium]|nr:hypothetical protein [Ignavibacteria bacterium]